VTGHFGIKHRKIVPSFFMLWGIPFVIAGQYLIWGRFFYTAWRKKRVLYAVANLRIIVLSLPPMAKTITAYIDTIPVIDKEIRNDGIGTLKIGRVSKPIMAGKETMISTVSF